MPTWTITEEEKAMKREAIEGAVHTILQALGVADREGTEGTPRRVAKMFVDEICGGLFVDTAGMLKVVFSEKHNDLVSLCQIPFFSLCEHHLVPFYGKAHVAYIPRKQGPGVIGLSKIARLVKAVARQPQVQERLTRQIANALQDALDPAGVMVVMEAEHMCMTMRGVQVPGTITTTSVVKGVFKNVPAAREEFMRCINLRKS